MPINPIAAGTQKNYWQRFNKRIVYEAYTLRILYTKPQRCRVSTKAGTPTEVTTKLPNKLHNMYL